MERREQSNEKLVDGKRMYRRFAYLHKTDRFRYGILEASSYRDARDHLGSSFRIKTVWLSFDEAFSFKYKRKIVSNTFGVLKSTLPEH